MVKFRDVQLSLLGSFITEIANELCPNVIVQGYKSVGKTYTVSQYLKLLGIKHTIVNCEDCITHKILLQRCLINFIADSGHKYDLLKFMYKGLQAARTSVLCENFAYFLMLMEQFIVDTGYGDHHVLVLDRFDQCCDPTDELFASFLKLREYSLIRNISVVYITSHGDPREILTFSTPHVSFGPYSQSELTAILQEQQLGQLKGVSADKLKAFWAQFAKLMVDLFYDHTGSDLLLLQDLCGKLWPKFAERVGLGQFQPTEFIQIYREIKDEVFNDEVVGNSVVNTYGEEQGDESGSGSALSDLPYHSKFILLASYLASHVDPKSDLHLFSRMKLVKKQKTKKQTEHITKKDIDSRLLSAALFDLERLKAILSVIYRNESKSMANDNEILNLYQDMSEREIARKDNEFATFTLNTTVDVNVQLATLASLGLLTRTYALDILSSKIRWKCNVNWDTIEDISREINFPIQNYAA